jgi:hypothetical protein
LILRLEKNQQEHEDIWRKLETLALNSNANETHQALTNNRK